MTKSLLQIDAAIAKLRQQIKEGTNKQIALIKMAELLEEREEKVKAMVESKEPTRDA